MFPAIIVTLDTAIVFQVSFTTSVGYQHIISVKTQWQCNVSSSICITFSELFKNLVTAHTTVIYWLLQLLQEWVKIIFKDSFMFQIVRMWDGFRPNQTGDQAKTLSDEFWIAIKARSKPRTDVFLKVSTEGSTTMSFFVSYLPRLWRRRPTVICKWSKYLWNFAVLSQIL